MKVKETGMKLQFILLISMLLIVSSDSNKPRSAKRDSLLDGNANKGSPAVAAAGTRALKGNPKIQEAVVEKGLEVAGKLVDKQLKIIEDAQNKASDFLKKEIKLDILPEKGWENEDMFLPAGYHINAAVQGEKASPKEVGETPYVFPAGIGGMLLNGCWGKDYKPNDPCYKAKTTSKVCTNMIDGAAFLGVGFDGRGKYSPDSRKMSIVQRNCANKATYDNLDVPDTMNVHGIYDTSATLLTFESREEYSKFLKESAGVSGSFFGFYAGVKSAWGEATQTSQQKYLAVMDVDVDRYEVFMDEVKPNDLSPSFLREFMGLPLTLYEIGGVRKYQNFIQRYGTHFIKSAKFGGQLEIRKTMDANDVKNKKEFEIQMEVEYKSLFASGGSKYSREEKESERKQKKTTSTSVVAQGGSQDIASILSDVYSPTFKTAFKEWLKSIPSYPKAFNFQMGSITDLLDFRANDLFPEENVTWGCEGNAENLLTEEKDGKTLKYYEVVVQDGTKNKYYCEFDNREVLKDAIQRRRSSLKRAMEIYMEEGPNSISDIEVHAYCSAKSSDQLLDEVDENGTSYGHPTWEQITKGDSPFNISFDMLDDLPSSLRMALNIQQKTSCLVRFENNKWHTSDQDGTFHLYGLFDNGDSKILSRRKMSIFGLVLTYNEADGSLVLSPHDYKASKKFFPTLQDGMTGIELAQVKIPFEKNSKRAALLSDTQSAPCRVDWSNNLRFDPTDTKGKCLHFTASAEGELFVIFAALPEDRNTWYYVEIAPTRASIYKGAIMKSSTINRNARALGDASLYQSYFVCITETETSTLIEYGKSLGSSDSGDVYLNMIDSQDHLHVRFYTFGAARNMAKVMDAHIVSRAMTKTRCKGDTKLDKRLNVCVKNCHKDCDPLAGCKIGNNPAFPAACHACRVAVDTVNDKCIPECPPAKTLTKEKTCAPTFDIMFKPSLDYKELIIEDKNIPTLKELTICFWLRLEGRWEPSNQNDVYLVRYDLNSHRRDFLQTMIISSEYRTGGIDFFFRLPKSGSRRITLDELENHTWLQMCVAWSGFTGVAVYYKNGKRDISEMKKQGQLLNGGGTLRLGGSRHLVGSAKRTTGTIHLTGVNLWNRVLSDQEIAKNAERCDGGEGNVKNWLSWLDVAKAAKRAKKGFLRFGSKCGTEAVENVSF